MGGAGEGEQGLGEREEAAAVSGVEPVADHHPLVISGHHQVLIGWGPVERHDGALQNTHTVKRL